MDNPVWRARLHRCAQERSRAGLVDDLLAAPDTRVLDWSPDGALVDLTGPVPLLVLDRAAATACAAADQLVIFLGRDDTGAAWLAAITPAAAEPAIPPAAAEAQDRARARRGLRDVGHRLAPLEVEAFMTAQGLASWHATHPRCPRCGAPTDPALAGWVRRCRADGSDHYPRTDPAVIMAVIDAKDRLLLARAPAWPPNRRSVLAGFVEPGERLEAAVAREVAEEVGVTVRDVRYVGSQPWPFPASLMLGFTARTDDEQLAIDDAEIVTAQWYTRAELSAAVADGSLGLPGPLSIARRLIEGWFGGPLTPPRELPFHRSDPVIDGPLGPSTKGDR